MTDQSIPQPTQDKPKRRGLQLALVGAGIAAGAIGATALGASAESTTNGAASAAGYAQPAANATNGAPSGTPRGAEGGSAPIRDDEKSVSAADAAKLKAAALKAVPGGTVYRVETDAGDATYEAHMTKADGTPVTVKFDKNFAVTKVEDGMGTGDPAPAGRPQGGDH